MEAGAHHDGGGPRDEERAMKIVAIGGGPAGLYFSILMKQLEPRAEITVYERNRSDDTFGWGVVFSDETLNAKLDYPSRTLQRLASTRRPRARSSPRNRDACRGGGDARRGGSVQTRL